MMEEVSGPCAVSLGEVIQNYSRTTTRGGGVNGCKLAAEKGSLLSENESDQTCNSGDDRVVELNQVESDDSCISREYNHQGNEEDGSISSTQFVASDISSISVEEISGLEVNYGNKSDESDKKPSESDSSLEVPQQKKVRKTETKCLFELGNIPLWGFTSIRGRRPEMEDAFVVIPRFLQVPSQILKADSVTNGMNRDLTAHFYGVYDGHGGCQVCFDFYLSIYLCILHVICM